MSWRAGDLMSWRFGELASWRVKSSENSEMVVGTRYKRAPAGVEYDEFIDRAKNLKMLDFKRKSLQKRLLKIEIELSACNTDNMALVK